MIEQAKGIVAEHNHVSIDDAFTLLRGYARDHNRLVGQTAGEIINGTGPSPPTRSQHRREVSRPERKPTVMASDVPART